MRLAVLLFSIATAGFAGSWSGYLVDSHCWSSRETNVSQIETRVDRDMQSTLRYCSPTADTKAFALVLDDWSSVSLDAAGNERAIGLVRGGAQPAHIHVTISGTRGGGMITTGSVVAISRR
jgi:hypothetical protein